MDFQQVYKENAANVRRILFGLCHPNDLDDLVQIVFMKVYENLGSVRDTEQLRRWIYRIALNTAKDRLRQRKRGKWLGFFSDGELPQLVSNEPSSQKSLESRESLEKWLQYLTPKLRETLVLYSLEELDIKEIGHILEIPVGTVKSRLFQARETLKPLIEKEKKYG